ncbi:MAG: lamin tail domain-containing protein [Phycisphaerales bacterium]|nr:MAG: lamin tail domain-containing protein [Phycisphaerales bacterium]
MISAIASASVAVWLMGAGELAQQPARADRHPIISEVLFNVPSDPRDPLVGDANLDGNRDAIGDEFVELFNPHDVPIQLAGYTIVDGHPPERNRWRFTFPPFELAPGDVVVVFNGLQQSWRVPPGDERRGPRGRDDRLDTWVFTTRNTNRAVGLANAGDWVLLSAPNGAMLECVVWGEPGAPTPTGVASLFEVPSPRGGSVQRTPDLSTFEVHPTVDEPPRGQGRASARGVPYSPGRHPG